MFGTVVTAVSKTYTNTKKALESKWGNIFELKYFAEEKDVPKGHKIFPNVKMHWTKANSQIIHISKSRVVFNGANQVVILIEDVARRM
jgi:hypothetical protein